jgi:tetratricopeptide (TPR) repeat protein
MKRTAILALRVSLIAILLLTAYLIFAQHATKARPARRGVAATTVKKTGSSQATLQSERNIGKAYYEQGKYVEAVGEFQKVVASGHALAADHMDLGLCLMQANRLDEALGELTTARQMDPKLTAVEYNLGILYKRELRYPEAEAALKRVISIDPEDPAAWFNLGTVYLAQRKFEDALDAHEHVEAMGFARGENFYVASLFRAFTALVRLKRTEEAQKHLKLFERMRDRVPTISLQNPALEGGKYGAILIPPSPLTQIARKSVMDKVTFTAITDKLGIKLPTPSTEPASEGRREIKAADYSLDYARQKLLPLFGPSIVLGDYDSDGHPDLYVVNPAGTNRLFHNNGDGTFTDVTAAAGVAGPGGSLSATFADYDNSGHPSLFVVGLGGVRVYQNKGGGKFTDVTEKAGLKPLPGELDTRAVLFDADNDGFLDLIVTAYTNLNAPPQKSTFLFPDDFRGVATHFYRNDGDGTFTKNNSLAAAKGRMRGAVFADFDNDGYTDLFFYRDDGPALLFQNLGEGRFERRRMSTSSALAKMVVLEAHAADFNHDGNFDLAVWSSVRYEVLLNHRDFRFTPTSHIQAIPPPAGLFRLRGAVADVNGDSFADLLTVDAGGKWHLLVNRAGRFEEGELDLPAPPHPALDALHPTWLGAPGKLDLVGITHTGQVAAYEKAGPPTRWLVVKLNGYKSNNLGIGSIVELKAGNYYDKLTVTGGPVRVFTGDLAKLDVVRVTWPNAVVQNWIDVTTDKPIEVRESERLASSCPLLYAWDGRRFGFVTDVLGVAPLGELAPDGTRVKPYPDELVRLPETLRPENGDYVFQLTDELREVDYFDRLRLLAVDHPASEEIYSNEIYSSAPAPPSLYAVRAKRFPVSAVDDHGHDVLPLLLKADGRYPSDFGRNRILGLADLHTLSLDLGNFPAAAPVSLWLRGWVFWTDSNGARALMSNQRLKLVSPYLQVRNPQGQWVTVIPDMGLPSGTNRTMRVDLTGKFLSADHHVRIVTNLCVYWDQAFFTTDEASAPPARELPLVSADLHYRGFSRPVSDPEHLRPDYFQYEKVLSHAPWNPMVGRYTRYGAVEKLLSRADSQLVAMATGDEMTVRFSARGLPPLRPGWKRAFFLAASGWAKDGEPNTAFAKTVAPLPFREMANYPPSPQDHAPASAAYRSYEREYLTRPGYALIPPLAPAIQEESGKPGF